MRGEKRNDGPTMRERLFSAARSFVGRPVENPPYDPYAPLPRGKATIHGAQRAGDILRHSTSHPDRSTSPRPRHSRS